MSSSSLRIFSDLERDLWQMVALPIPKWTLVHGLLLGSLVPTALILFNKKRSAAHHAIVRCWCRSSSSLYLLSFLSAAISSCFWLLAPLLSLSCFVEIVYQKIAAKQLSSDCPFLFFISSAPSPYRSFISSQLLDFFLCFASESLFVARKSGLLQILLSIRHAQIWRCPWNSLSPISSHIPVLNWTAMPLRHTPPFLSSFLAQVLQIGVFIPLDLTFHKAMLNLFIVKLNHSWIFKYSYKCFN